MFFAIALFLAVLAVILFFSRQKQESDTKRLEKRNYEAYLSKFDPKKNLTKLAPAYTKVAGTGYKNDDTGVERPKIIAQTKVGEMLMLIPDPTNRFDPDAVKVVRLNGEQIGFLDMDTAVEIKSRLERGSLVESRIVSIQGSKEKPEVLIEVQKYSRRQK